MQQRKSLTSKDKKILQEGRDLAKKIISLLPEQTDEKKDNDLSLVELCKKAGGIEADPSAKKAVVDRLKSTFLSRKKDLELSDTVLEKDTAFLGRVEATINMLPSLYSAFETLSSGALINFMKKSLLIYPSTPDSSSPSSIKRINQEINSAIIEVENINDLQSATTQVKKVLPGLLKFWSFDPTSSSITKLAEQIVKQGYYRNTLNENIRKHIPKEVTIQSPKTFLKSSNTPLKIKEINQFMNNLVPDTSNAKHLNKLLTGIGIKLALPLINSILSEEGMTKQNQKVKKKSTPQ